MKKTVTKMIPLIACLTCAACSNLPTVNAWDKAYLAKAEMRFDRDRLQAKNGDHVYASKEAASGGSSVGGGGCGCN